VIFTETEYRNLLAPLIIGDAGEAASGNEQARDELASQVVFSFLCEPSDRLPAMLWRYLGKTQLLRLLIQRADAAALAQALGASAAAEIEDELQAALGAVWASACERWLPRLNKAAVLEALQWMVRRESGLAGRHGLLLSGTDAYPQLLEDLGEHRPPVLWSVGDVSLLANPARVAIVGSRQASAYGLTVTRDLAAVAASAGVVTVSGGAFGIDAEVHKSALALEAPTIAVMAGGLGRLYPRNNLQLLHEVAAKGLLISEVPPDVAPAKWRFLMRNRLIAGLSQGTVMVEAGRTSGAMSTANHAITLGREVAIVPGPMNSARSIGCHDFLNQNSDVVRILARPQQVLELAGIRGFMPLPEAGLGKLETRALDCFGSAELQSWEVQRLSGLTVRETQIALGSLELLGLLERSGSGYRRCT